MFLVLLKNNYTVAVTQISSPIEEPLVQSQCKDSGGKKVENLKLDLLQDVEENHGDNLSERS